MTFILKIRLQKYIFLQNVTIMRTILATNLLFLNPCEDGNVHAYAKIFELRIEMIYIEKREYENSNWHKSDLQLQS